MDRADKNKKNLKVFAVQTGQDVNRSAEFRDGVTDRFSLADLPQMSRKKFLALLSASAAFTLTGCGNYRDRGEIVPYTKKPEEIQPGLSTYYASTCDHCSQLCGILVKVREGRPVKIDGNPDHPVNNGKICAKGQASILNLYDPYRLREPMRRNASGRYDPVTWESADNEVIKSLENTSRDGKEIAVITASVYSPTTKKLIDEFCEKFPQVKIYTIDPLNEQVRTEAWKACYGREDIPPPDWGRAKVILCLEADILGTEGMSIEQTKKISERRDPANLNDFIRLYCVEGTFSLTGANSDYRLSLRPEAQEEFAAHLASEILKRLGGNADRLQGFTRGISLKAFSEKHGLDKRIVANLADDLIKHRGESMVYAGRALPVSVNMLVNYLNEILGNQDLFTTNRNSVKLSDLTPPETFERLSGRMKVGEVGLVIHCGVNPVYHLAPVFQYEEALKNVPLSVSISETGDETSELCTFILPANNPLESWGDFNIRQGIYSLRQPIIASIFKTRQMESVLLTWINGSGSYKENIYHQYLMNRWEKEIYRAGSVAADFKSFWYSSLHDGIVALEKPTGQPLRFNPDALEKITPGKESSGLTLIFTVSHFIGDGKFANNGWLQELPDPVSKVVWDNYAAISPATARKFNVENNDIIEVKAESGTVSIPALLQPGQADGCISISIGYGRRNAGPIGNGVGISVNQLMNTESLFSSLIITGISIRKTGGRGQLTTTQEHHSLDDEFVKDFHFKRKIIREGTVSDYRKDPRFLHHETHEPTSITRGVEYPDVKWAMAIDLSKCTGCSACVAGCNVENNIPVVGREQVEAGREMQWLRIDRYYSGTDTEPRVSYQPMLCQHCDNAPCENVCPVVATNHSPDGLNQMVYNRCVGTKYCSNNCPYKVRRFNFFDWRDYLADGYYEKEPVSLLYNPEVTVRSRGVMEKCTFCVQRIMEARQKATVNGEKIKGTDVRTACQDACPASAIVFGDMNDPDSEVSKSIRHELGYRILEEINARPNVTYLAKLRNTETDPAE